MLKQAEMTEPNSCLNRAKDDEPIFVLKSTDELAPSIVRTWAITYFKHKSAQPMGLTPKQRAKYEEAMVLAAQMDRWHAAYVQKNGPIPPEKSPALMMHDHAPTTVTNEPLSARMIVERLCRLQAEIYEALPDPGAADCFCMAGGFWGSENYGGTHDKGYRNDGVILRFIEEAVREKLARGAEITRVNLLALSALSNQMDREEALRLIANWSAGFGLPPT